MGLYTPPFDRLSGATDLDRVAAVAPGTVSRILDTPHDEIYLRHDIPKRDPSRGHRTVWEVIDEDWSRGLRVLNHHLRDFFRGRNLPGDAAHGYVEGRSIATNAKPHLGAPALVRADIADFFHSITEARVVDTLVQAGEMDTSFAQLLASLCCVDGHLALGFAPSPTIANIVASGVDERIEREITKPRRVVYTRYADDLTFSGPPDVLPSQEELTAILEAEGFRLNTNKFRQKKRGQSVTVTGLTVFDTSHPRVGKTQKRLIRQELYYIKKFGLENHLIQTKRDPTVSLPYINNLDGRIQFLRGIEPDLGRSLNAEWRATLAQNSARVMWKPREAIRAPASIFVDESIVSIDGGTLPARKAMSLAMVVVRDTQTTQKLLRELATSIRDDWRRTGTGGKFLGRDALHYVDLSEDVRGDLAKALESLSFRAFISYSTPPPQFNYKEEWFKNFDALLSRRMIGLDGAPVSFLVEQNSQIKIAELETSINGEQDRLTKLDYKRPSRIESIQFVSKTDDPVIWLPDIVLGLFHDYARSRSHGRRVDPARRPSSDARFERVRDKIRLVYSVASTRHWGPKHPFEPWKDGVPS